MEDFLPAPSLNLSTGAVWCETTRTEVVSIDSDERRDVVESLQNKVYRDAYAAEFITAGVPFQIRANRQARGWTQKELGRRAEMKQGYICRLENPDSGMPNLETLKRLASAFDVALVVRFIPFSELVDWTTGLDFGSLEVEPFESDRGFQRMTNVTLNMPVITLTAFHYQLPAALEEVDISPFQRIVAVGMMQQFGG